MAFSSPLLLLLVVVVVVPRKGDVVVALGLPVLREEDVDRPRLEERLALAVDVGVFTVEDAAEDEPPEKARARPICCCSAMLARCCQRSSELGCGFACEGCC